MMNRGIERCAVFLDRADLVFSRVAGESGERAERWREVRDRAGDSGKEWCLGGMVGRAVENEKPWGLKEGNVHQARKRRSVKNAKVNQVK